MTFYKKYCYDCQEYIRQDVETEPTVCIVCGGSNLRSSKISAIGIGGGTAYPSSPIAGDMFFRTDLDLLMRHDGTNWVSEYDTTVLYIFTDYSATTFTGGVYSIGTYTRFKLDDAKKGLDSNFNDFKILFQVNGFGDGDSGDCVLYDEDGSAIVTGSELDFSTDTWQGTRKDVDVSSLISDGTQYAIAGRNGLRLSKASIIVSGRRKD